jgi:alcohol dehydrogenase
MRAARIHEYGPPDVLRVDDIDPPAVRANDVLVDVHAAAVNPVDAKIRSGSQRAVVRLALPHVLGLDVSGVVVDVGSAVTGFAPGDEVFSSPHHGRQGTYAERVAIDAAQVARKPPNLTHAEAASIPLVGLTAWQSLISKAKLTAGETVLIHAGAGGVGSFAIQLAKHVGATVITTCSARNVGFARELGADRVIDYNAEAFDEVVTDCNVVFDMMGADIKRRSRRVLRRGGRLVTINTDLPATVKRWGAYLGVLAVGCKLLWFAASSRLGYGIRSSVVVRSPDGAQLGEIAALLEQGAIRPIVGQVFPLDRIADAHRAIETGRTRGKIVIQVKS